MKTVQQAILTTALLVAAAGAFAQPFFVTGDNPPLDGFSPGSNAALEVNDTGTSGDLVAADGIFSADVTLGTITGNALGGFLWKVASSGFAQEFPKAFDAVAGTNETTGATVKFLVDTNTRNDGFFPDAGTNGMNSVLYTIPVVADGAVIRFTGSFQDEIGAEADWSTTTPLTIPTDDGLNGDTTATDNIYTKVITGLPAGSYSFVVTFNGSFDTKVANQGFSRGAGGDYGFTSFSASDNIKLELDRVRGRVRVTNDNPLANPGPPFFAVSEAWGSTALDSTTQLYDDGTNGDVNPGDNIYSRSFTVTSATAVGTTSVLKIRQGVGPEYPSAGNLANGEGYGFEAYQNGEVILVQFDTNTYNDGYQPSTRFVWVNPHNRLKFDNTNYNGAPASPVGSQYIQAVGAWQDECLNPVGSAGLGSDWTENSEEAQLFDTGSNGVDTVAGDGIYAKTFDVVFDVVAGSNYKIIGGPSTTARYNIQFGGANEGLNFNGNPNNGQTANTVTAPGTLQFAVDAVLGRRAEQPAGAPQRPGTINAGAAAGMNDWSLF